MNTPISAQLLRRAVTTPSIIKRHGGSVGVWLALMAYLVAVKLVITVVPATFRHVSQAAVFGWPFLAVWTIAGLIGIWLARRTGFPNALDQRISNRQRFVVPALIGLGISVAFVAHDLLTHYSQFMAARYGVPRANIDFPASLPIYSGGAVIVEVFYRLLPLPLLLWLFSNMLLKGRAQAQLFIVLAVVTSLIEPLTQDLDAMPLGVAVFGTLFALDFSLNLTQATLFRKYGFLAAIVMRVAFYMVWHIAYVH